MALGSRDTAVQRTSPATEPTVGPGVVVGNVQETGRGSGVGSAEQRSTCAECGLRNWLSPRPRPRWLRYPRPLPLKIADVKGKLTSVKGELTSLDADVSVVIAAPMPQLEAAST